MADNNKFLINKTGLTAAYRTQRDVIIWRTPGLGFIEMYINPQQVRISQRKVSTSARTKAGFVYQYAGEDLTTIAIDGTTGSAGIEGINLLEKVYRAEQIRFEQIASTTETQQALGNAGSSIGSAFTSAFGSPNSNSPVDIFGSVLEFGSNLIGADPFEQPYPTLATLASAVEMNYQGVTYRGYFTEFSYTESAQSPGLFDYNISFTSYAKSGERLNFMPWHRRPDGQSNSDRLDNFSISDVTDPNAPPETDANSGAPPVDTSGIQKALAGRKLIGIGAFTGEDLTDNE